MSGAVRVLGYLRELPDTAWVGLVVEGETTPWSWASLPGLRGRPLTTRFSIGDWLECFTLHDGIDGSLIVNAWCATERRTPGSRPEQGRRP